MGTETAIEWCDHTFNPWIGCTAISCACDNCYAKDLVERYGGDFAQRRRTTPANWRKPLAWDRKAAADGVRRRVFCASLADVFDNQVPSEWRRDLFELILRTPHLNWLLLTKRPQNVIKLLTEIGITSLPTNVWLGTTVEDDKAARQRVWEVLHVPATIHFLSCEPLLGHVDLTAIDLDGHYEMDALNPRSAKECWDQDWAPEVTGVPLDESIEGFEDSGFAYPPSDAKGARIDWVICGGESGPNARPMHPDWARALRDQCAAAGVAFLFKQWGQWAPAEIFPIAAGARDMPAGTIEIVNERFALGGLQGDRRAVGLRRIGKKRAGRLLDGVLHDGFPTVTP